MSAARESLEEAGSSLPKVTLITGGTRGIGLAFARAFAARGHDLAIVARTKSALEATARELSEAGSTKVHVIEADLSTAQGREKVERYVHDQHLVVEYLVNNAGYGLAGFFEDIDRDTTLNMIELNIGALTDLTRRFLPHMVARGGGGILNISSLAGLTPGPYQAAYYATKAYVNSLTFALAHETRRSGVKIGLLMSGPVATEFHSRIGADTAYYIKFLGMEQPDAVARYATDKFLSGSRAIVPGVLNKFSALLMKLLPRALVVPGVAWLLRLRGQHSI